MTKIRKAFKYMSIASALSSVLYVASIGPAAKAIGGAIEPDKGFYKTFYQPVEKLAKSTKTEDLKKSYLKMWGVKPLSERVTKTATNIERSLGIE
jgi:hypothetical protein